MVTEVISDNLSYDSELTGFSSRLRLSKAVQLLTISASTSAMKFLLASILFMVGMVKMTLGIEMKEFWEMLTVSKAVQLFISSGRLEMRLLEMFKSLMRLKLMANLGGILEMTLPERLQLLRVTLRQILYPLPPLSPAPGRPWRTPM